MTRRGPADVRRRMYPYLFRGTRISAPAATSRPAAPTRLVAVAGRGPEGYARHQDAVSAVVAA
ncbi:hypothetical protein ACN28C_13860 [Plantactinospora sp. WMMC1484]|uniref:hypothetical protein n=1 Tax=Plantactinospora sp. WMMC1484 TaxID=3404122 RepID=UPI003BF60B4A